jgi:uncharacterized protein (TIGR03643 family)
LHTDDTDAYGNTDFHGFFYSDKKSVKIRVAKHPCHPCAISLEQSSCEMGYYYMKTEQIILTDQEIDRIIEMAWEDRTPFDAITAQFGLKEQEVIEVMRKEMKPSSFRMWRERVQGRATKHRAKSVVDDARFKCTLQKKISLNKISKRK